MEIDFAQVWADSGDEILGFGLKALGTLLVLIIGLLVEVVLGQEIH